MTQVVSRSQQNLSYFTYLNILAFLAVIGLSIPIGRRLGAGYALYTLLSMLLPMFSRTESMIRYILVLFPVFMAAGAGDGRFGWIASGVSSVHRF